MFDTDIYGMGFHKIFYSSLFKAMKFDGRGKGWHFP